MMKTRKAPPMGGKDSTKRRVSFRGPDFTEMKVEVRSLLTEP
jgi:hypothetical protein